jgi:hypothetical protein
VLFIATHAQVAVALVGHAPGSAQHEKHGPPRPFGEQWDESFQHSSVAASQVRSSPHQKRPGGGAPVLAPLPVELPPAPLVLLEVTPCVSMLNEHAAEVRAMRAIVPWRRSPPARVPRWAAARRQRPAARRNY